MSENEKINEVTEEVTPEVENNETQNVSENKNKKEKKKVSWQRELLEWVLSIGIAVAIGLVLNTFVFRLVLVDGNSMNHTLQHADRLFLLSTHIAEPKAGDIIVFDPVNSDKLYIKRVIATEGQTVDIKFNPATQEQLVYVDGELIDEPYAKMEADPSKNEFVSDYTMLGNTQYPITVEEDCYFVMGDNRPGSHDSRATDVGQVHKDSVSGKVLFRWWPFNKFGGLK